MIKQAKTASRHGKKLLIGIATDEDRARLVFRETVAKLPSTGHTRKIVEKMTD
ncbi:MAG: hypothetical protein WCC37_10720 [Candidatus Sulfotelmatobacter sp.]